VSQAGTELEALPEVLPVFTLPGCLLLPGNWLPLNIFELRYRAMVADAMRHDRHLAILQPRATSDWPALALSDQPDLYEVGGVGHIDRCEPQPDGRFHILLRGLQRFRIRRELPLRHGYRRVEAAYDEFSIDAAEGRIVLDPRPILASLAAFSSAHGLTFDLDLLASLPGVALVNGLAAALPFETDDKQALLEAADLVARHDLLLALMETGAPIPPEATLPTVH
jgi:Lon protease-like protein